jgi:hypothetical protein
MTDDQRTAINRNLQADCQDKDYKIQVLRLALSESVKLQSHYAELLNMHDNGRRMRFASADEWIERLSKLGTIPCR